jgi:hypothetical protein
MRKKMRILGRGGIGAKTETEEVIESSTLERGRIKRNLERGGMK